MTSDQRDLLNALAFLYLRHGQNRRALALVLLTARHNPDHAGSQRILAYAFVANGAPEEALSAIQRLDRLDGSGDASPMRWLLEARALLHAGRTTEARAMFRRFVDSRTGGTGPLNEPSPMGETL